MDDDKDFVSALGVPFLAHRLRRLSEQFLDGYGEWLPEVGVNVPPRALSLMLLVHRSGGIGVMEIASKLRLSHPLIIRLVRELESDGFLKTAADKTDARRRVITVTARGEKQVAAIKKATTVMGAAYQKLFDDIGVDVLGVVEHVEAANAATAFRDRLRQATKKSRKVDA